MKNVLLGAVIALTPLLLLAAIVFTLRQRTQDGLLGWALLAAVFLAVLHIFSAWFMPWYWLGDGWKIAFTILSLALIVWCYLGQSHPPWFVAGSVWSSAAYAVALFCVLAMDIWLRFSGDESQLNLKSPIEGARYYINHGGTNRLVNHHYSDATQRYAADIVVIDGSGRRAKTLYPNDLGDYFSFDYPLVAPCSGTVRAISNEQKDQQIGHSDRKAPAGNYVFLACGKYSVLLAHLKHEASLGLKVNDQVNVGQRIGHIGNSGNTSEPHLHLHVVRDAREDDQSFPLSGVGVPFTINDRKTTRGKFDGN